MRRFSIVLLACGVCAQNWPSFRGPGATGVLDGHRIPIHWDAEQGRNIAWKTAIPGLGHSSPVVWGDRIFVTTAISSDPRSVFKPGLYGAGEPAEDVSRHSWRVYCLDRKTGKSLWERVAHEGAPKIKRHPKASHASSTPATDGQRVVVFFGSEGLFCFDFDGKLQWKQDLGVLNAGAFDVPEFQWGNASSPIIYKNLAIVQCDIQKGSFIAAFDLGTGKQVWRTPREALPSWATPTVYEGKTRAELITNGTEYFRGYDPLTGKELWRIRGTSMISVPTPFAAGDLIYLASGYRRFIQPIYALRPGANGDAGSSESVAWSMQKGAPYLPTPIVYGEHLYTCAITGVLVCYKAKTGERVYEQRIGEGGAFSASPAAADGRLYVSGEDGTIFVIKAGPQYELLAANKMGEVLMATPALSDRMLIVRGQHHVFGIRER